MITDTLKELEAAKAKIVALQNEISFEQNEALKLIPAQYGFESVNEFIAAVRAASRGRLGRKGSAAKFSPGKAPRKRAKITDEIRAQVKKLVAEKWTGLEIAKKAGISLPSVQNIKNALGLAKKRKK